MILNDKIQALLRERCQRSLTSSKDCEEVARSIASVTHRTFGSNTLRRLLGFYGDDRRTYRYTLDTLAIYLGYTSWTELCQMADEDTSDFSELDYVFSKDLRTGDMIRISYQPDRRLTFEYLGEDRFKVTERQNSKLLPGDTLLASIIAKGEKLVCHDVEREGKRLGTYRAGLIGGLTDVEVIPSE